MLDSDTLLLEYSLGEKRSYAWVVTPTSIKGVELPARQEIEATAQRVTLALTARNREVKNETVSQAQLRISRTDNDYAEAASELGKMVLGPVSSLLGQKRVVIVADGALQLVPFAALPTPTSPTTVRENSMVRPDTSISLPILHSTSMKKRRPSASH